MWIRELDCEESWAPNNWCFWTVVLEKTLGSHLNCKEIKPVHPKGNQYWVFIGRTDAEAETPILWPCDVQNWLIWKHPDAGKDWRWEEKGTTEDEMVGWQHGLNGHEFQQTLGVGDGQRSLACYSPWGHKELDMIDWLNWTVNKILVFRHTIIPQQNLWLLLLFDHSVMSNSLQLHGLQQARPPCPSLSPRVCPSSCSLHRWCHPAISSSDALFSFCPLSFPASGLFQWVVCSHLVTKILELQLQHQSFQWIFRIDLP